MRRSISLVIVLIAMAAAPVLALSPGMDVLVPAAGRGGVWVTDLYEMNPGDSTVNVTVYWLVRNQSNTAPQSFNFNLVPGETAVFSDVILQEFGLNTGFGGFRVVAASEVIVNSRIYATEGTATFGQGFEGVPMWAATMAGSATDAVGLTSNDSFRSNVYALSGPDGATMEVSLLDLDGIVMDSVDLELDGMYVPYLRNVVDVFPGVGNFDNATLHVAVSSGAAVVGASKVDNLSTDPTTLESAATGGGGSAGSIDGTYQISLYDTAGYAAGGNLVITGGIVTAINGTYFNYDKLDGPDFACPIIFQWGIGMPSTPVEDFADGVVFSDSYQSTGGGILTWDVVFTPNDTMSLVGTVTAVGSEFPGTEAGCNGTFPPLTLFGGKTE